MKSRKRGFGLIGRKHLEQVPELLERANARLTDAHTHIRNRNCAGAIWNSQLAAQNLSRAYAHIESANMDAFASNEYSRVSIRLQVVTKEITERCIERSRCGEVSLKGLRRAR